MVGIFAIYWVCLKYFGPIFEWTATIKFKNPEIWAQANSAEPKTTLVLLPFLGWAETYFC